MADIGIKIGLEGEKEFKKSLSDINASFKVLASEMNMSRSNLHLRCTPTEYVRQNGPQA